MKRISFRTAGESHGRGLTALIEGIPAGLELDMKRDVDPELKRRQGGYGRGRRMQIESDQAELLSGVRLGETLGSPISMTIWNRDWENWTTAMRWRGRVGRAAGGVSAARGRRWSSGGVCGGANRRHWQGP